MRAFFQLIKDNLFITSSLIFFIAVVVVFGVDGSPSFLSTRFFIQLFAVSLLSCSLIFKKSNAESLLKHATYLCVPVVAIISIILLGFYPFLADAVAMEDRIVENISALGLFMGSLFMFICTLVLLKRRYRLAALLSMCLCAVFFVIGMEEISWFQRVMNIETVPILSELNDQGENNLHNINTKWSERVYYIGAFSLLILIPFFRDSFVSLFSRFKLSKSLTVLIPSNWLFLASAVMIGFITAYTATNIIYVTMYVFTIIALLYVITTNWNSDRALSIFSLLLIALVVSAIYIITNMDYNSGIRRWVGSEYREMFIGVGIGVYAFDTLLKSLSINTRASKAAFSRRKN